MLYHSRLPGFYQHSTETRREIVENMQPSLRGSLAVFDPDKNLSVASAEQMIENSLGVLGIPIGVAANFLIDGVPVLVPMAVEEPSVIAAASHMASLVAQCGGFTTSADKPVLRGQIQLLDVQDCDYIAHLIAAQEANLRETCNKLCESMVKRGGGCVGVKARSLTKHMMSVDVLIDCQNAMGANLMNTVLEGLAPEVEALTGCRAGAKILSNLADTRLARASCRIHARLLATDKAKDSGPQIAQRIIETYQFALHDPYRASTHNKGIFNGIDPIAIATGNDWRALEAGGHAYAARTGRYLPLSCFDYDAEQQMLNCSIELPIAVGVVGGSTRIHPGVKTCLSMLKEFGQSSMGLSRVMAAVGLAENLGSLRALSSEGIQQGHMALHRKKQKG